ncbi:MAG: alcohol dehydrogenase catalytic domain-containing protein [Polyangiaceae bacterium]|nr:alcohol dehydrogenase catalytic domain-containing protein [Polyangiaceae bacterium]
MKALVCTDRGVVLDDLPTPELSAGDALVSVRAAGICNTDLELARGYMNFRGVLGHEVLGQVAAMHPDDEPFGHPRTSGELAGRRVVMEINCACGRCSTCRSGGRNHCPTRTVLGIVGRDGGIAEYVRIPLENLHVVPDSIADDHAVFIEPLAAALHAFDEAPLRPGDRVCLLGDGKLGLLIGLAMAARRGDLGRAIAVGRHRANLDILAAAGLDVALEKNFSESGFDVVIEATGHPSGLARAIEIVRPRGVIILKSTYAGESNLDLAPIVIHEIKLVGSRCGDFARAIDVLSKGVIDPTPLIAAKYPLADAERAFAHAGTPGVMKVMVVP